MYENALDFMRKYCHHLLSNVISPPGDCNWELLADVRNGSGEQRFRNQFFRANIDPSERYVLSVKQSTQYRLRSDQSGFSNLYLAGDWTHNGVNAGCVEAAVMSGLRAAMGLSGRPIGIIGESFGEPK